MSLAFQRPDMLLLIPAAFLFLVFIMRKTFVHFQSRHEQEQYVLSKRRVRALMLVSRLLAISLLLIAVADPFTTDSRTVQGSPRLSVFVDQSTSMELFDTSVAQGIRDRVAGKVPATVRTIAFGNRSALGDALINFAQGDDSVLLVTDGHATEGRSLGDVLLFVTRLNTTVSALELSPLWGDAVVSIQGPARTTVGVPTDFFGIVEETGDVSSFTLTIEVDGKEVLREFVSDSAAFRFSVSLSEGYHRFVARISADDHFPQNNVFYKVVKVEPKPKVLLISPDGSPLRTLFSDLYDLVVTDAVPFDISRFSTVVLEDTPAASVPVQRLVDYVSDGNGLVVVGGRNSFDHGGYKDSVFESVLPVVVGSGEEQPSKEVNVVLLLDISGTSAALASPGGTLTKAEVAKSLTSTLLDDLKPEDNVAVIAFHTKQILVSPLTQLSQNREELREKVSRIFSQSGPGTLIDEGIASARQILAPLEGSKSIILISDGIPGGSPANDIAAARTASRQGTKVYAIQVGEDSYGAEHLQSIAEAGNGVYFTASEGDRLRVLFGKPETDAKDNYRLQVVNGYHFITQKLALEGVVTGFNQVVPKSNADLLVATADNHPLLTVWRFGLGRVAVLSSDDGSAWAGQLLSRQNSPLLTKTVNWAVGDLSRNKAFDVRMADTYLGRAVDVTVLAESPPLYDELDFAKAGDRLYTSSFMPDMVGFRTILHAAVAVNYPAEFLRVGMNPQLGGFVQLSKGQFFAPGDIDGIVAKVLQDSRRVETTRVSYAWIFVLIALLLLLGEIAVRKIAENRNLNK